MLPLNGHIRILCDRYYSYVRQTKVNMSNVNTLIYDKSVDRAAMTRLYADKTSGKVELIVDGHAVRVDALIKESKLQGTGLKGFLAKLDVEISKTVENAHNVTSRSLLDLFSDQVSHTVQSMDAALKDIWRTQELPQMLDRIDTLMAHWGRDEVALMNQVSTELGVLFELHERIKSMLPSLESYSNPFVHMERNDLAEEGGPLDHGPLNLRINYD